MADKAKDKTPYDFGNENVGRIIKTVSTVPPSWTEVVRQLGFSDTDTLPVRGIDYLRLSK